MKNIIAIDVASEVSAVCILGRDGRISEECLIPTELKELGKVIDRVRSPKQVVFEEGTQAAWLWSELSHICSDILVCDPRQNRQLSGSSKSDKADAKNLAFLARSCLLKPVWHGGESLRSLREGVRLYATLTQDSTRQKNRLKAVFRSSGLKNGRLSYSASSREEVCQALPLSIQRERVRRIGKILDALEKERSAALKTMVSLARRSPMYRPLRTIDGIGPIFASMFISEVGSAQRFRTRSQLWAYGGLSINTHETSQFEVNKQGQISRRNRAVKTRGLTYCYNRVLKYVFKQAAMTLSRTAWKEPYRQILANSKNANNAQLTLARKLASVMLHIAKTGETYDVAKVFRVAK